jgi:hypothetical protein
MKILLFVIGLSALVTQSSANACDIDVQRAIVDQVKLIDPRPRYVRYVEAQGASDLGFYVSFWSHDRKKVFTGFIGFGSYCAVDKVDIRETRRLKLPK